MNIKHDQQEISLKNTLARFLDFELDCNSGQLKSLQKTDISVHLEPLLFQFLLVLISKQGEIVSKQEVVESLWPGKTPSDAALRSMVKKTRDALNDDAKNPNYIKTIPNKGYMLIPTVKLSSTVSRPWFQKPHYLVPIVVPFILFLLSVLWFFDDNDKAEISTKAANNYELELLSESSNTEVSTYFNKNTQSFVSLQHEKVNHEKVNIEQQDSLLFEDHRLKRQFRVSYENQILDKYLWSETENAVLLTRSDNQGFYITQLLNDEQSPITQFCPNPLAGDMVVLGFRNSLNSRNSAIVFLRQTSNGAVFKIDCDNKNDTATLQETAQALDGLNAAVLKLPAANNNKPVVSAVWLSPNDTTLIALVNYPANASNLAGDSALSYLLTLDISSVNAIKTPPLALTGKVKTGVWNESGDRFSFSNHKNKVFSYQLEQNQLVSWFTGNETIGQILSDCGNNCFIVSNKKAISQSVFMQNPLAQSSRNVQTTIKNLNSVPEGLITAINRGYYFASPIANKTTVKFREWSGKETVIHTFESIVALNEFKVNHLRSLMVGLINKRPFVLDLKRLNLAYLSLNVASIQNIRFVNEQTISYYSSNTDGSSGLYYLDLISKQLTLIKENTMFSETLSFTSSEQTDAETSTEAGTETTIETSTEIAKELSAELIVDAAQNARIVFNGDKAPIKAPIEIGLISAGCDSCWQLRANRLYQFSNNKLSVTLLPSMTVTEAEVRLNSRASEFDISPNEEHLVFVLPQNDIEEIKKISELQPIF